LVAALFADRGFLDDHRHKLRSGAADGDGTGRDDGYRAGRVFEIQDAGTAFLVLAQLAEENTVEILLTEHGGFAAAHDLPTVPMDSVWHLKRNSLLTCRQVGGGYLVGYGQHLRALARQWQVELPAEEEQWARTA
jgi:hypothetical protein